MLLVTNDDGIHSPGLHALVAALRELDEVFVVAPDRERSAVGHSFTMNRPIRARKVDENTMVIDGTPTDCVMFAVLGCLPERPRMVVSGIDHGPNMGEDVTYSGTVAAALEGTLMHIPSLAVSLDFPREERGTASGTDHFETAAQFALRLARRVLEKGLPNSTLLNVNLPNIPPEGILGVELTRLGKRIYKDRVIKRVDPHGQEYFWIGGERPSHVPEAGTDFAAVNADKVSITPLRLEMTDYAALEQLRQDGLAELESLVR